MLIDRVFPVQAREWGSEIRPKTDGAITGREPARFNAPKEGIWAVFGEICRRPSQRPLALWPWRLRRQWRKIRRSPTLLFHCVRRCRLDAGGRYQRSLAVSETPNIDRTAKEGGQFMGYDAMQSWTSGHRKSSA